MILSGTIPLRAFGYIWDGQLADLRAYTATDYTQNLECTDR